MVPRSDLLFYLDKEGALQMMKRKDLNIEDIKDPDTFWETICTNLEGMYEQMEYDLEAAIDEAVKEDREVNEP